MVATPDTGNVNRDKVGGHSWNLHNPENGFDYTAACVTCHGPKNSFNDFKALNDFDGNGAVESIPDEVKGLLTSISILLPPTGQDSVSWTMIRDLNDLTVKKAYWNYRLISNDGSNGMHNSKFTLDVLQKTKIALGGVVDVEDLISSNVPSEYKLSNNYPNPFNPSTIIRFSLPFDSKVKIVIYNINGELVKVIADGEFAAGEHETQFNTNSVNGLASGIYLYSITAISNNGNANFMQTKKMVLLK
jgi:hypothetical protein